MEDLDHQCAHFHQYTINTWSLFISPAKRSQHANAAHCNIVGRNVSHVFGHRVAMCYDKMGAVGSSFEMVKFEPTTPNTWQNVATGWPNARHVLRPTRYISYYPSARAVQGEYRPEVLTVRTERSEVCTKKTEGRYSPSTVPSKINKRFITRLEKAKTAKTQVWDHSGQCPVRYLENN